MKITKLQREMIKKLGLDNVVYSPASGEIVGEYCGDPVVISRRGRMQNDPEAYSVMSFDEKARKVVLF